VSSEPHPPNPADAETLLVRYWDGSLTDAEMAALNGALRHDEALRTRLREMSLEVTALSDRFAGERSREIDETASAGSGASTQNTLKTPNTLNNAGTPRTFGRGRLRGRWVLAAVLPAAAATAAALVLWLRLGTPADPSVPDPSVADPSVADPAPGPVAVDPASVGSGVPVSARPAVARVAESVGTVVVETVGAAPAPADVGSAVPAGGTVRTEGVEASADIVFADGTRLTLAGNTAVTVEQDGPKRVIVRSGNVAADVTPQPAGAPMRLRTPEAEIEVVGTRFALSRGDERTAVGVAEGSVRMVRLADGKTRTVAAGSEAIAEPATELKPIRLPPAPDEPVVAFDGRLPPRWGIGQFVADDLPKGSGGAVRAVQRVDPKGRTHYAIGSHNAWTRGIAALHADTWFHIRLRVDRPGPLNLLLVTRDPDLSRRRVSVIFAPPIGKLEPGRWHTLSFPITAFHRAVNRRPPELPLMVFHAVFESVDRDRGLTVERFWFTREPGGGSSGG
jgi:ferric-dicitrate binding protein FerR (iron transport regulator)